MPDSRSLASAVDASQRATDDRCVRIFCARSGVTKSSFATSTSPTRERRQLVLAGWHTTTSDSRGRYRRSRFERRRDVHRWVDASSTARSNSRVTARACALAGGGGLRLSLVHRDGGSSHCHASPSDKPSVKRTTGQGAERLEWCQAGAVPCNLRGPVTVRRVSIETPARTGTLGVNIEVDPIVRTTETGVLIGGSAAPFSCHS
jgi:hypothetical protein